MPLSAPLVTLKMSARKWLRSRSCSGADGLAEELSELPDHTLCRCGILPPVLGTTN